MTEPSLAREREMPLIKLVPNAMTLLAVCAGLSAIRDGFAGEFERAVQLILAASVLDGLDGRMARLLRCESPIGAELDSLADFLNFGVAPGLVVFAWGLQGHDRIGWIAVLIFAISCLFRLARFNVVNQATNAAKSRDYFVGVPAPAGAILVLLPMFLSFAVSGGTPAPVIPPYALMIYMVIVGGLMISRLPTYSFKNIHISRGNARYFLFGVVILAVALASYTWIALLVLSLVYVASVIVASLRARLTN